MHIWLHFDDFIGQNNILFNNIKYGLHKRIKLYNKLYFFWSFFVLYNITGNFKYHGCTL